MKRLLGRFLSSSNPDTLIVAASLVVEGDDIWRGREMRRTIILFLSKRM